MSVAKELGSDEYTIRHDTVEVIKEWESDSEYNEEVYDFAEAVIRTYIA